MFARRVYLVGAIRGRPRPGSAPSSFAISSMVSGAVSEILNTPGYRQPDVNILMGARYRLDVSIRGTWAFSCAVGHPRLGALGR